MRRLSFADHCARPAIAAVLVLTSAIRAHATDTYGPSPDELQIPSLAFGSATLENVVLTVNLPPLSGPTGIYPVGSEDSYFPSRNQLNVPAVAVGSTTHYNARTTVNQLISIGSVSGADTFDGTNLLVRNVQVGGGPEYHNVTLHVGIADVAKVGGGMPGFREDQYNPGTKQLTIAAVQVNTNVYTNVVVKVKPANIVSVGGYSENVLFKFQSSDSTGALPWGPLVMDASGNLYGTTQSGGSTNGGTVFELSPNGSGGYDRTVLYTFKALLSDGANPGAGVILDASGNLYGTTMNWGAKADGTVFKLTPNDGGGYTESVLHSFQGEPDGASPNAALVIDPSGNLYGTTKHGGSILSLGYGTVFRLAPNGGGYTETVLHTFQNTDGAYPVSALIVDANGGLYGTTTGGASTLADGVVFKLTPTGGGNYSFGVLYAFKGGSDGADPQAGVMLDPFGNLFGTTYDGGASLGTVFELSPNGSGGYIENVLYRFQGGADGSQPSAGVVADAGGALYGTTQSGGGNNVGTVFKLSPNGSGGYTETTLHSFANSPDGAAPKSGLMMNAGGNLYGTTFLGGSSSDDGIVFEIQ